MADISPRSYGRLAETTLRIITAGNRGVDRVVGQGRRPGRPAGRPPGPMSGMSWMSMRMAGRWPWPPTWVSQSRQVKRAGHSCAPAFRGRRSHRRGEVSCAGSGGGDGQTPRSEHHRHAAMAGRRADSAGRALRRRTHNRLVWERICRSGDGTAHADARRRRAARHGKPPGVTAGTARRRRCRVADEHGGGCDGGRGGCSAQGAGQPPA
jgi:hypothetical protein